MAEISMHEWTGSSRSLTRTATLSASSSSFSLRRRALRFSCLSLYLVPEGFHWHAWRNLVHFFSAGVASGATRAALTQHFSLENNAADISAKEGSQETVATMVGMVLGMLLAHVTIGHYVAIWFSFLTLTIFHLYAKYKAVCSLSLTTLNDERSSILLKFFLETGQVLSPQQVSMKEHVIPSWICLWKSKTVELLSRKVHLGVRVSNLKHSEMLVLTLLECLSQVLGNVMTDFITGQAGVIEITKFTSWERYLLLEKNGVIRVIIHKDSTAADVLQSYIHALVTAHLLNIGRHAQAASNLWVDKNYSTFMSKLQASGWNTERILAPAVVYRTSWECNPTSEKSS